MDQRWEQCAQKRMLKLLAAEHAVGMSAPTAEPIREDEDKEEEGKGVEKDKRKGSSSTGNLAPGWVPAHHGLCPWCLGSGTMGKKFLCFVPLAQASGWLDLGYL